MRRSGSASPKCCVPEMPGMLDKVKKCQFASLTHGMKFTPQMFTWWKQWSSGIIQRAGTLRTFGADCAHCDCEVARVPGLGGGISLGAGRRCSSMLARRHARETMHATSWLHAGLI